MERNIAAFIAAALFSILLTPLVISFAKKLKLRQTVLEYVDNHAAKSGTPTMGGIAFVLSAAAAFSVFTHGENGMAFLCLIVTAGYGLVGFLDDFIKVRYRQNKGLSAWQKIIFQVAIAVCVSLYAYFSPVVGDKQFVPVSFYEFSLGIFAVPFYIAVFLAASNAVNLIDGLDGLAAGVTKNYLICFSAMTALAGSYAGVAFAASEQGANITLFCMALAGALCGFGVFNCYPAKIFMGDTGSLALGGALACVSVVTKTVLVLPVMGIMYVFTALSVIIQVAVYKCTRKRVFLMSPVHHHYERKGVHENRIVAVYSLITLLTGAALCFGILIFG